MKTSKLLLILLCLLTAQIAAGATVPQDTTWRSMSDTNTFKTKLKNFSASFTGMECDFTQQKTMKMLRKPVISHGVFACRGGKQVRWEYDDPFVYIIVISNDKITIVDENKSKTYDMTANKSLLEMNIKISAMVDGSFLDNHRDFRASYFENENQWKVDLLPRTKDMKAYFSMVSLIFDKSDLSIAGIIMSEKGGDQTTIYFYNKKINKPISDERFVIK